MTRNVGLAAGGTQWLKDNSTTMNANVADGNTGTMWTAGMSPLDEHFVQVILPLASQVVGMRIIQSTTNSYHADSVTIQSSVDGVTYVNRGGGLTASADTYLDVEATTAQWWRIIPAGDASIGWSVGEIEIWGDPIAVQYPLEGSSVGQVIQWLYDHAYQDAADKLEELDPGWTFSIVETFLLAGMATCVQLASQILSEIEGLAPGEGGDNTAVLEAIETHDDVLLAVEQALSLQSTNIADQLTSLDAAIFGESQVRVDSLVTFLTNGLEYNRTNDNTNTAGLVTHINDKAGDVIAAMPAYEPADLQPVLTAVAGVAGDVADAVNPHTTAAKDSINGNVDAAEVAILDALAEVQADTDSLQVSATTALADLNEIQATLAGLVIPTSGGLRWPGSESVTLSNPVVLSEPTTITADCHGCIVDVLVVPSGQSVQHADTATRYKGIAWLAFESDRGDWEALQQINLGRQVLLSKELEEASALAVYCKPGAQLRVTPFTLTPA